MIDDSTSEQPPPRIEWDLWFQWMLATTVGWAIAWAFIGEVAVGALVGLGQWFVLRSRIPQAGWWIWASTVGWAVGWAMIVAGVLAPPNGGVAAMLVTGVVLGAMTGLAQWFILRQAVHQAGWWIVASTIGWTIGLTGIFGSTVTGAVVGAVTGFALDILLRYPYRENDGA